MKQKHYSEDFKEQALAKVFGRSSDQSVDSIADGLKMSKGTLRNWMKRSLLEQKTPRLSAKQSSEWTARRSLVGAAGESRLGGRSTECVVSRPRDICA